MNPVYHGRFLDGGRGKLYAACFGPLDENRVILHLPAFAEEMNLSRAVVSRQAYALAEQGWTVVVLDYFGTGDSEGDISEADAELWLEDVHRAVSWIREFSGKAPVLWGLRFGGLLACEYAERFGHEGIDSLLLWRPVTDGRMMLNQFFRLKQMGEMMQGGQGAKVSWFKQVQEGGRTEVGGYEMTPELVNSVSRINLKTPEQARQLDTHWLEPGLKAITPVIEKIGSAWQPEKLRLTICESPAFWQNPDVYSAPQLHSLTLSALEGVTGD